MELVGEMKTEKQLKKARRGDKSFLVPSRLPFFLRALQVNKRTFPNQYL